MTAQHGILKPNPVLFDLEKRKKKPQLAHELGAGAPCQRCGDKCPGFQLHYWRKHCINCRCGKIEHDVVEECDPGFYFVGRIFDLPLRSKREELEFCYGVNSSSDDDDNNDDNVRGAEKVEKNKVDVDVGRSERSKERNGKASNRKRVKFDWIPPNVSSNLAKRYLNELPETMLPVAGSDGAKQRQRNLEKQFPVHDVEPEQCHELTATERESMKEFVAFVKENVAGQGIVQIVTPPKPQKAVLSQGNLDDPNWFPPPPPELLISPSSPVPESPSLGSGTFRAVPYTPSETGSGQPSPVPPRKSSAQTGNGAQTPASPIRKANVAEPRPGHACVNCREDIEAGSVAIRAERAGPKKMWHPRCFCCQECKELLVDLLYYYDDGGIYCARDYAKRKSIPRCHACDELIFCAEYTGAEDSFWHIKHFCCWECDRPLAGHKYISVEGQPHCLICYQTKHGKVCITCGEYIAPEDQRVSIDEKTHWHARADCFHCQICRISLLGKKLTKKFGLILCSSNCARKAAELNANDSKVLTTDF